MTATTDPVQMKPSGSRAMKPQQIRDAAARLFRQQGYGAVSMDAIAREAGVSKATIYAHFADKAELFAALMTSECEQWRQVAMIDGEASDLRGTLTSFGRAYIEFLVLPRIAAGFRMVVGEANRFPELGRTFIEYGPKTMNARLAGFFERAEARGVLSVPDRQFAAQQFLALLRCDFHLRVVLGLEETDPQEIDRVVHGAVDVFLRAYGRAP
jgi:TetR/AcrR family transcriptional repressor of mexJK operon